MARFVFRTKITKDGYTLASKHSTDVIRRIARNVRSRQTACFVPCNNQKGRLPGRAVCWHPFTDRTGLAVSIILIIRPWIWRVFLSGLIYFKCAWPCIWNNIENHNLNLCYLVICIMRKILLDSENHSKSQIAPDAVSFASFIHHEGRRLWRSVCWYPSRPMAKGQWTLYRYRSW